MEAASAFDTSPDDAYEIILIDNGSTHNCDEDELRRLLRGLVVHRIQNAMVSPVPTINFGLAVARGDLVGVCLDGPVWARVDVPLHGR